MLDNGVLQVSNDVRMVLPLLVAIIMAKWIADAVSHSLYHSILEVKCVPMLHTDVQSKVSLDLIPVHHVMASPVVTFQETMPLNQIREILRDTRHNGFPVVRNTPQGQVFVGLVVRDHLMVLLRRALARGTTANLGVTYEDLNHQFVTAAARHLVWEQHMAVLQVRQLHDTAERAERIPSAKQMSSNVSHKADDFHMHWSNAADQQSYAT